MRVLSILCIHVAVLVTKGGCDLIIHHVTIIYLLVLLELELPTQNHRLLSLTGLWPQIWAVDLVLLRTCVVVTNCMGGGVGVRHDLRLCGCRYFPHILHPVFCVLLTASASWFVLANQFGLHPAPLCIAT